MSHRTRSRCKTRIPVQPLSDDVLDRLMSDVRTIQRRQESERHLAKPPQQRRRITITENDDVNPD